MTATYKKIANIILCRLFWDFLTHQATEMMYYGNAQDDVSAIVDQTRVEQVQSDAVGELK